MSIDSSEFGATSPVSDDGHELVVKHEFCTDSDFEVLVSNCLGLAWEAETKQREISRLERYAIDSIGEKTAVFYESQEDIRGTDANRHERRRVEAAVNRCRTDVGVILQSARLVAAGKITEEDARAWDESNWSVTGLMNRRTDRLVAEEVSVLFHEPIDVTYDKILPLYEGLYGDRRAVLSNLYSYLADNPAEIGRFLLWTDEQAGDPEPDTEPLLTIIANDIHDSGGDNFAKQFWTKLKEGEIPLDLRLEFLADSLIEGPTETASASKYIETVKFARTLFPGSDTEFIQSAIDNFESWPESLAQEYDSFHKRILNFAEAGVTSDLQGSVRRAKFEPINSRLVDSTRGRTSTGGPGKKRLRVNGRTTTKLASSRVANGSIAETEQKTTLNGYGRILKTDRGYIFEKCERDKVVSMLEDYSKVSGSGSDMADDMVRMLDSIYEMPLGEGATIYRFRSKIQLGHRKVRVWHLNPDIRPSLDMSTASARRTRINYCIVQEPESDQRFLGILSVLHHNDVDQYFK